MAISWVVHVLGIELKKAFSYRFAFWAQFVLGTVTDLVVAYFLWAAIFSQRGELGSSTIQIGGFTFHGMIYYYLFAAFSIRIARGSERGYVSEDIYGGGLTKYLLYPVSFLGFKFITHFTQQILATVQLLVSFSILWMIFGKPEDLSLSIATFAAGFLACLLAGVLHFFIAICLEMVSFWQDVVWNLMVMLRFMVNLLGGAILPLTLFPEWGRTVIAWTPFPLLVSFPAETFLGRVTAEVWLRQASLCLLWAMVFFALSRLIWSRGLRNYSGVGI